MRTLLHWRSIARLVGVGELSSTAILPVRQTEMMYGPIVPTLKVASVKASLTFYTDALGFVVKWSWSSGERLPSRDNSCRAWLAVRV